MKKYLILFSLLLFAGSALAEEIDGEINVSFVEPYDRLAPGFSGSYRPETLEWRGLSLGAGLALHISSRFRYETTEPLQIADTSHFHYGWYYFDENFLEITDFDFFVEGRWQFLGRSEESKWRAWLSLIGGMIINSSTVTRYQTQYEDSSYYVVDLVKYSDTFQTEYRSEAYLSPGFLIGIGNFIVGYRHWLVFDNSALKLDEPGRMLGTLRLGYRFTW